MSALLRRFHLQIADTRFFLSAVVLLVIGLMMLFSASGLLGFEGYGDPLIFLKRQASMALLGILCGATVLAIGHRFFVRNSLWIFIICLSATALCLMPGVGLESNGAKRWIAFSGFSLQPVEFLKLSLVLYLTKLLSKEGMKKSEFVHGVLPSVMVMALCLIPLLAQPDFGNLVILASLSVFMLFIAGARLSYLLGLLLFSLPALFFVLLGEGYRRRRLLAFLDPWSDPSNSTYQILQSFTAFFQGGLWGKGLGNSHEKLYYLPEAHTDFIGSVIAEELGFLGFSLFVAFFFYFIYRAMQIAIHSKRKSSSLLAVGMGSLLAIQVLFNLAVITGLVPTKGLPLPFVSLGGSNLVASLIVCGFILSVASENVSSKR